MPRDNFKESIKAALRDRVAHRCSNPACRVPTAAPGAGASSVIRCGDAAHITAASPKGPRYDGSLSAAERSSIGNGIWLCVVCARKIDQNPEAHPVQLLHEWKTSAETAATQEFGKPLLTDSHLHEQMQRLIAQGDQMQRETLAKLNAIQASLAMAYTPAQMGVESRDHVLEALKRLEDSGKARGLAAVQLSADGRYEEAATEAIRLAEDEASAATYLNHAAQEARCRAAARYIDAGDIAFVHDRSQAVSAYERCTEIDPSNPYGWSRLGEASWWMGRLDKALHAFGRLWRMMPNGVASLALAGDSPAVQQARFKMDHPQATDDAYIWVTRGIMIAGLNIVEILRREPSLVSALGVRLVPLDRLSEQQEPTEIDAPGIAQFFSEKVYDLGKVIHAGAASAEHRRILEGLSRVAKHRGELDESEGYLQRAHAMCIEQKDVVGEVVYLCNLGVIAGVRGHVNTARDYLAKTLALCQGDPKLGRLFVGTKLLSAEEVARRHEQHEQQVASGTARTSPDADEIEVCNLLADEFERDTEAAMQRALVLKDAEGNARGNLGLLAMRDGDLDLARQELEASLALHEQIGCSRGILVTRNAMQRLSQIEASAHN